jgi:hypothetical protein
MNSQKSPGNRMSECYVVTRNLPMSDTKNDSSAAVEPKRQRKPYVQPQLRALGAVHELTLGAAMTTPELPAGFKAM